MVYVLALASALSNALTSILQRIGVEDAPPGSTLSLRLLAHAVRRRAWLLGTLLMVMSFVTQAFALHVGRMSQVQPLLTTELLFLVLILSAWFRFRVRIGEWLAALAAACGLSGFLLFADPTGGTLVPSATEWLAVGASCGGAMAMTVVLALRGPPWWRAAMFGTGAAIGFGFAAALTKVVGNYVSGDWSAVFRHWESPALAAVGLTSMFLAQNAFHVGPIAASQSALVLVDPLASILIGVNLFGDNLRTTGAWGPLEGASLLVLFTGAVFLARSPLVSGARGDGRQELRSARPRPGEPTGERLAGAVASPPAS
ncbi:MAG TPA: DMT family transporter [Acidimicrobiales bacterium]|nr:DMT family transporter [Acidimicrobiales bacterium]